VDQGTTKAEALFHAFGETFDWLVGHPIELREAHHSFERVAAVVCFKAVRSGKKIEVLFTVHKRVSTESIGHPAESFTDTVDPSVAFGGHFERRKDAHAGGLTGSVGADEAKHFTAMY